MKKYKIISVVLISIVTFLVFVPTLKNDLLRCWDDYIYVVDNQIIHRLSLENLKKIFSTFLLGNYHPLTLSSFALEYQFFESDSRVYHTTNLILHIVNSLLVFWLIFMLCKNLPVSIITAILFSIHPLRAEPVAWVSGRKDLLAAIFFFTTLIFYLYYQKKRLIRFYYISLIVFVLSLLSKATGVILPFVLLLFDYFTHQRFDKKALIGKIPYFVIALGFGVIAIFARQSYQAQLHEQVFTITDKVFISIHRLIFYFFLRIFAPVPLVHLKPFLISNAGVYLAGSIIIIIVLILLVILLKKHTKKIVLFGLTFFFITILPALNVVVLGYSADRFTYIPSIGIFYIGAEGFFWLFRKKMKYTKLLRVILLIILIGTFAMLVYGSRQNCKIWQNCLNLTGYFIENYPNEPTTYLNRGIVYEYRGEYEKAIVYFTRAVEINPNYAEAYNRRANIYVGMKDYDKAIFDYNEALRLEPEYAEAYFNRGNAYYDIGYFDKAISDYTCALKIDSTHAEVYYNRGNIYAHEGKRDEAIVDYTMTLLINPNHIRAYYNRAVTYLLEEDYERAIAD
ncbi:MAG: tetratricopeptide repeat protein, partial [bacterium]